MHTFSESVRIDAPVDAVWDTLAEIATISAWNPGVRESYLLGDHAAGLGARRFCDLGGSNYLHESVAEFEPGRRIVMRIDETNLPFSSADVQFDLREVPGGTEVTVSPVYVLKYGPLGKAMDAVMVRRTYRKGMARLLDGLKGHVEASAGPGPR